MAGRLSNLSILARLQLATLAITIFSLLVATAMFLASDMMAARQRLAQRLQQEAAIVGSNSSAALLFNDADIAQRNLRALGAEPCILTAAIYLPDGSLFARHERSEAVRLPDRLSAAPDGVQLGPREVLVRRTIVLEGKPIGTTVVRADSSELEERFASFARIVAVTLLVTTLLAVYLSTVLHRGLLVPIRQLALAARQISSRRDFSIRVPGGPPDEVGDLVAGFNEMLIQLEQRDRELARSHQVLEEQVAARTAELSRTNADLETMLHVTSHDLREPLRAIENFAGLLQARHGEAMDEKGRDFLRRIERGAIRLARLLEDILLLSRAQRAELAIEAVEARALVDEALGRLEMRVRESRARIQVAPDLPLLRVNRLWATQAIYNLLANAIKFTKDGEPPDIEIAPWIFDGEAGLVIRDRGPGVQAQHAERIFELFQRAVGREVEGTGAGLAIVRQVAQRHGGRAVVQPRPGGGSEFILTFAAP